MDYQPEQLTLDIPIRPKQEVFWLNVRPRELHRLFGKKIISDLLYEEGHVLPSTTSIDADKIPDVRDPDLRYALRFASAIDAVGWVSVNGCMAYKDSVHIEATDDGVHSRLVSVIYSGKIDEHGHDTFWDGIYGAKPSQ